MTGMKKQEAAEFLFLSGFMGVGKSTIGKLLAKKKKLRFLDLDKEIERVTGKKIPNLFQEEGEAYFRGLEFAHLVKILRGKSAVIALGGGTLEQSAVRDLLKRNGKLVGLWVNQELLLRRLWKERKKRPLDFECK
jgi:shikimate kinase